MPPFSILKPSRRTASSQNPRRAPRPPRHSRRLVVAWKHLGLRVPLERPIKQHRDIRQVTYRAGPMPHLCVADGLPAVLYAVEEILYMVVALVQMNLIRPYHRIKNRLRLGLQLAPVHIYPSFAALESRTPAPGLEKHLNAVGIRVLNIDLR